MLELLKDKESVSTWYQERARKFGWNDPRSLGYNQLASQQKRFEALCQLGDFNGRRILDVGCGTGDFLNYLLDRNITPDYMGLDLVPDTIDHCKERFKDRLGALCRFEAADTLEYDPHTKFDYVIACGLFGLRSEKAEERILPTLRKFLSWSTMGVAVNFLSARATRHNEECQYMDPAKMLSLALDLTPSVRLSHSYLPNDFTLYLYRSPSWEQPR